MKITKNRLRELLEEIDELDVWSVEMLKEIVDNMLIIKKEKSNA